ncbi:hypothetical protein CEXT_806331 [Caerostris extrusa]|uniref:Uncharacterized protein n=1 Tax=Caerostris extrusa TaxID=172846 RepID=A0AAV4N407_CAEEX|nr:hypothetical protein CEXT_806331 [Caerostris extrusa]
MHLQQHLNFSSLSTTVSTTPVSNLDDSSTSAQLTAPNTVGSSTAISTLPTFLVLMAIIYICKTPVSSIEITTPASNTFGSSISTSSIDKSSTAVSTLATTPAAAPSNL